MAAPHDGTSGSTCVEKKRRSQAPPSLALSEGGIQSQSTPQNGPSSGQPRLGPRVPPSISIYLHLSPSISVYLQPRPIGRLGHGR